MKTWSNASANSDSRTRSGLPVASGWGRSSSLGRGEREEGGEALIQGLGLNMDPSRQTERHSDRKRSRAQSLGMSNVRKRASNFPKSIQDLPPPSD